MSRPNAQASFSQADDDFAAQLVGPQGPELVVQMVHDLRSPLTSILFLAERLQQGSTGPVNEAQRRQLGIIYSAALGLCAAASDVIELARGGRRLMDGEPSLFSLREVFESVRDMVRPMAEERGLPLLLTPPRTDRRLGYPRALRRALLNLTTNAVKYTEEGYVEIAAREVGDDRVEFSVRDTGPGIDPQTLRTLYQAFKPSKGGARQEFSCSGVGLAICRRLVAAMGSSLQLETQPGQGTRFYFLLHLPAADRQRQRAARLTAPRRLHGQP